MTSMSESCFYSYLFLRDYEPSYPRLLTQLPQDPVLVHLPIAMPMGRQCVTMITTRTIRLHLHAIARLAGIPLRLSMAQITRMLLTCIDIRIVQLDVQEKEPDPARILDSNPEGRLPLNQQLVARRLDPRTSDPGLYLTGADLILHLDRPPPHMAAPWDVQDRPMTVNIRRAGRQDRQIDHPITKTHCTRAEEARLLLVKHHLIRPLHPMAIMKDPQRLVATGKTKLLRGQSHQRSVESLTTIIQATTRATTAQVATASAGAHLLVTEATPRQARLRIQRTRDLGTTRDDCQHQEQATIHVRCRDGAKRKRQRGKARVRT